MYTKRLECSDPETSDRPIAGNVLLRQEPEEEEEEEEEGERDGNEGDDDDEEDEDGYSE